MRKKEIIREAGKKIEVKMKRYNRVRDLRKNRNAGKTLT